MRTASILVPCKLCQTKVNYSDLRRNKDGFFVCSSCLNHTYSNLEIPRLAANKPEINEIKKQVNTQKPAKTVLYCSNCKFTFTRPLGDDPHKGCPYCNQMHSVQVKQTAADLLRDIDSYMQD